MQVFIVSNRSYPDNRTYIDGVYSSEEKAWNEIERCYYYYVNYLIQHDEIIKNVKFYKTRLENRLVIECMSGKAFNYIITRRFVDAW